MSFRFPILLYRLGLGGLLGTRFLLLTHTGRKSGRERKTVLEVVRYDRTTTTFIVAVGFGSRSDWYRNILIHPHVTVQCKRCRWWMVANFLTPEQSGDELVNYFHHHPLALQELARFMGYRLNGTDADVRALWKNITHGCFHTGESMITVKIFNTPVKLYIKVLPIIFIVGNSFLAWIRLASRAWILWQSVLIGLITTFLLLLAEFGHPFGHIFSARHAGAPIDEIIISGEMPRTIYWNNEVTPRVHRIRAIGGPLYNVLALLISITIYEVSSSGSVLQELMTWSAVGHGLLIIMSLSPLPFADGGTILKWTLVERGKTVKAADETVQKIDWVLGIIIVLIGIGLIFLSWWIVGLILLGVGGAVFGIAAGKIH